MATKDRLLRQTLGQQFLDLGIGHPTQVVHAAMVDALATSVSGVIALGGGTLDEAAAYLRDLTDHAMAHLVQNWGTIQRGDH